jgi:hypothetical protein
MAIKKIVVKGTVFDGTYTVGKPYPKSPTTLVTRIEQSGETIFVHNSRGGSRSFEKRYVTIKEG